MTASAPIVGTLRAIPDAASAPPPDSGVPAHANFRSVLEQYHSSRESAAETDTDHTAPQKKQKDSDATSSTQPLPLNPAGSPMVPQSVTPPAEPPRLILPFTTSITLRQDTSIASPDDTATLDSTTATDPTPQSSGTTSGTVTTLPTPVIFRSTFDLRSLPLVSDSKSISIPAATQSKTPVKGQAKLSKESAPSQDAASTPASTAPADTSTPLLPAITSSTLQPATTAAQTSSTVSEAPEPVPAPAPTFTVDRRSAYQFHSSSERPAETLIIKRTTQEPQKTSDPTPVCRCR